MTTLPLQGRRKREHKSRHLKERDPQTTHFVLLDSTALSRMREPQIRGQLYCGCLGESFEHEGTRIFPRWHDCGMISPVQLWI